MKIEKGEIVQVGERRKGKYRTPTTDLIALNLTDSVFTRSATSRTKRIRIRRGGTRNESTE